VEDLDQGWKQEVRVRCARTVEDEMATLPLGKRVATGVAGALAEALQADGWAFGRRTAGAAPGVDAQAYLADTMGELGLWYRLAPVSFVGGSLDSIGGHNPFEPAALGSAILHGPHVANFADIYRRLTEAGAARLVSSPETLAEAVGALLSPDRAAEMAHAAWGVVSSGAEAVDRAVEVVLEHLPANGAAT